MSVICHIAGPSGSGKTTFLQNISYLYPTLITKDLDVFDEEACHLFNLDSVQKKHWTDGNLLQVAVLRQKVMDEFLEVHKDDKVVLGGFHTEDAHVLHIPTKNIFLIDTDTHKCTKSF